MRTGLVEFFREVRGSMGGLLATLSFSALRVPRSCFHSLRLPLTQCNSSETPVVHSEARGTVSQHAGPVTGNPSAKGTATAPYVSLLVKISINLILSAKQDTLLIVLNISHGQFETASPAQVLAARTSQRRALASSFHFQSRGDGQIRSGYDDVNGHSATFSCSGTGQH